MRDEQRPRVMPLGAWTISFHRYFQTTSQKPLSLSWTPAVHYGALGPRGPCPALSDGRAWCGAGMCQASGRCLWLLELMAGLRGAPVAGVCFAQTLL